MQMCKGVYNLLKTFRISNIAHILQVQSNKPILSCIPVLTIKMEIIASIELMNIESYNYKPEMHCIHLVNMHWFQAPICILHPVSLLLLLN